MTKSARLLERAKKSAALSLSMASAVQTSAKNCRKVTKKRAKKKTRVKAADKRRCVPLPVRRPSGKVTRERGKHATRTAN